MNISSTNDLLYDLYHTHQETIRLYITRMCSMLRDQEDTLSELIMDNTRYATGNRSNRHFRSRLFRNSGLNNLSPYQANTNTTPAENTNTPIQDTINNSRFRHIASNREIFNSDIFPRITTRQTILNRNLGDLSPVTIRPTNAEIQAATEEIQFSNITLPPNSVCPITQERFTNDELVTRILFCGHIFKSSSINTWFNRNTRCPLCRYDIRRYSSATNEHLSEDDNINREAAEENTENTENVHTNTSTDIPTRNNAAAENDFAAAVEPLMTEITNLLNNSTLMDLSGVTTGIEYSFYAPMASQAPNGSIRPSVSSVVSPLSSQTPSTTLPPLREPQNIVSPLEPPQTPMGVAALSRQARQENTDSSANYNIN